MAVKNLMKIPGKICFFFRIEIFVFHEAAAKNLAAVSEFVRTLIV